MRFFALAILAAAPLFCAPSISLKAPSHSISHNTHKRLSRFRQLIEAKKWDDLGKQVRLGIRSGDVSIANLVSLSNSYPTNPFTFALIATKRILALKEKTGLSFETAFPIALFAETTLANEVTKGKFFWSEKKFGRELQYDKTSDRFFIHLGTHGVAPLGEGIKKVVTKTILYNRTHPAVMARGLTIHDIASEMSAMCALRGLPCLLNAEALLSHVDPQSHQQFSAIVTKIFNPGCLHNVLRSHKGHFTLKEKLKIALDLTTGLSSMHKKGYVHRDLGARNHFINISGTKPGARTITCVIADMGRTMPAKNASGEPAQANPRYRAPEAFFPKMMKGTDYYASDVFAVGCVLWTMYYEKLPHWMEVRSYRDHSIPLKERCQRHTSLILSARKKIGKKLYKKTSANISLSVRERFERILNQMTDPNPKKRGSAELHAHKLSKLYAKSGG